MNILVVDDENMNLVIVFSLIATLGLFPIVCNTGEQAFKVFRHKLNAKCCSSKIELVLTDI